MALSYNAASLIQRSVHNVLTTLVTRPRASTSTPVASQISDNKSSAVAEMGDRFATIDKGRKVGAAVPLSEGGSWVLM